MIDAEKYKDEQLLDFAKERMAHSDPSALISDERMLAELGISEEDLQNFESIDID